uniref:F-box domain-containing protein n=1 Tax=Ditylenchus dipsaci TaxID=166011 RepID=A0A915CM54_9BILA
MAHTLPTEVFHEIVQFFDAKQCGELLTVSTTFLDLTTAALLKLHESCLSFQPPAPHFPIEIFYNAMLIIIIVSVNVGAFQLQQKVEQVQLQMQHKVEQVQMQMQQKMEQVQMQHKVEQVQMQQKMEQVQISRKWSKFKCSRKWSKSNCKCSIKWSKSKFSRKWSKFNCSRKCTFSKKWFCVTDLLHGCLGETQFPKRLMKNDKFDGSTEGQRC